MGCCGKQRASFKYNIKKVNQAKSTSNISTPSAPRSLIDIPDEELDERRLNAKHRMIRIKNRNERIKRRNERALRIKAKNERKAIDN